MSIPPSLSYVFPYGLSSRSPRPVVAQRAPATTDVGYDPGTVWCDQSGNGAYINVQTSGGVPLWVGSGGSGTILGTAGQITVTYNAGIPTLSIPNTFSIGSNAAASSGTILVGTGGLQIDGAATANIVIGGAIVGGGITVGGSAMTGTLNFGNSTAAQTVNFAVGPTGVKTVHIADSATANIVSVGSLTGAASLALQSGTGGLALTSGATTPGLISAAPGLVSGASTPLNLNTRLGQATFTALTTAAGATEVIVVNTNLITATTQSVFVSVDNLGSNDAQMTVQRKLLSVGSITLTLKNNGAQALNGNLHVNFWVVN